MDATIAVPPTTMLPQSDIAVFCKKSLRDGLGLLDRDDDGCGV